jgi:hypothetical protein
MQDPITGGLHDIAAVTAHRAENEPAEKFCGECGVALAGNVQAVSAKASATKSTAPEIHIIPVQPDASEVPEGERKTVTALFGDIKGSTELERDLRGAPHSTQNFRPSRFSVAHLEQRIPMFPTRRAATWRLSDRRCRNLS